MNTTERLNRALNKLTKWRSVFAGWQLGTRPEGDAECRAVRDHREITILLRAEVSALIRLLIEKKVFTADEFSETMIEEAGELEKIFEDRFKGFKATDVGMEMDLAQVQEHGTMDGWRP